MSNIRIPADYKKKVNKSVKDWSTTKRTTFHPGEIIPIWSRRVMAGTKVVVDPFSLLASNPLVSKLLGTFKLQVGVFFDSDSNYYGWLDNNRKNSTQDLLAKTKHRYDILSRFCLDENGFDSEELSEYVNGQYHNIRGSVLDYMGIPSALALPWNQDDKISDSPLGRVDVGFLLTYLNIFRNYYASKQEDSFPVIQNLTDEQINSYPAVTSDTPFRYFKMSDLDDFFMALRNSSDGIDFTTEGSDSDSRLNFFLDYMNLCFKPHGGILLSTYLPDLLRNLLSDTYNTASSKVTVKNNQFDIDTLRFQNKLQRLIDRFDVSGGRFSDWLRTVWGVETRKDMDIPELIGIAQQVISPNQVTAQSSGDGVDLGQFGGNFNNFDSHRKHSFVASTPGRVMVCVTLVPMVDYSQGIDPELLRVNYADDYFPEFQQLGYQKVPYSMYSPNANLRVIVNSDGTPVSADEVTSMPNPAGGSIPLPVPETTLLSAGKQVAWLDLQTALPRVHGEFADGGYYESWVLKRRFFRRNLWSKVTASGKTVLTYLDSTSISHYINPLDYQYPFISQTVNDPNWELQMRFDVKAVLPMGKRYMPNLE
ncbi:MAG: major capsid protein [Chaetfec virus UA24_2292]|nr:MAG: major capsid protein [Chaetfec virus UA24_2292]